MGETTSAGGRTMDDQTSTNPNQMSCYLEFLPPAGLPSCQCFGWLTPACMSMCNALSDFARSVIHHTAPSFPRPRSRCTHEWLLMTERVTATSHDETQNSCTNSSPYGGEERECDQPASQATHTARSSTSSSHVFGYALPMSKQLLDPFGCPFKLCS